MNEIVRILIERDGLNEKEAEETLCICRDMVDNGEDPEEVLYNELGLEPDYLFDLLEF